MWNSTNDSQVLQCCLTVYSIIFEMNSSYLHIPAIISRVRRSMVCNDSDLRCMFSYESFAYS